MRRNLAIPILCGCLLLAVLAVFGQTVGHDFVNIDDDGYVYANSQVARGLTGPGVVWALTQSHHSNWIPLTWLSLMLDGNLYGFRVGGYHLTNVLLHAATAILLFLVLRQMTGRLWPSVLAAALVAIHPLRVESVAWVTERKDVLSGLFFMLTLWAYVSYARHRPSPARYVLVAVLFLLGLMAKAMLVTLPFLLLLLDYWPLERAMPRRLATFTPLIVEKIPLFAISGIACLVTILAQDHSLLSTEHLSLWWRVGQAMITYVTYLGRSFYPVGLSVLYPRPGSKLPIGEVCAAFLVLACITGVAFVLRRRCPYVLVGWLWYLGMLVPVIGLFQVGVVAVADRFTYLPQIGLAVALTWTAADVCRSRPRGRMVCGVASALILGALMGCSMRQASYWRNSETLWARALACHPRSAYVQCSYGMVLHRDGNIDEAAAYYRKALALGPDADAHNNLGGILASRGKLDAAATHFEEALKINPYSIDAHVNLGRVMAERGELDKAIARFEEALKIDPDRADIQSRLGSLFLKQNMLEKAVFHWRKAIMLQTNDVGTVNQLAWLLATCPDASIRNGKEAVYLAQWAAQLTGGKNPSVLGTLAAAQAEVGRFSEAIKIADRAAALAATEGNTALADALREQIKRYRAGLPSRQSARRGV
jgi:protein O-mannosyl-transferase